MTQEAKTALQEDFLGKIQSLELKIAQLETLLETYRIKEVAIREAVMQGKQLLGITGRESAPEILSRVMFKLPQLMTGRITFLNDLFELFKEDFNPENNA